MAKRKLNGKNGSRNSTKKNVKALMTVLLLVFGLAAVFALLKVSFPSMFGASTQGQLAAIVNGKQITIAELDYAYAQLPMQYKFFVTRDALLDQMIDENLLTQQAKKLGIEASKDDVDVKIQEFLDTNGLTSEELDQILVNRSMTRAELESLVANQIIIDQVLESEVKSKVSVSREVLEQYYEENLESFQVPALVTAKHILIGLGNQTPEEASVEAEKVFLELKDDKSNFCDLVEKYSTDFASVETCGEYTFPRGQMVEEFENAAFEQPVGQAVVVNTMFGAHIIWTINKTQESTLTLAEVEAQVESVLAKQQEKALYQEYILSLRDASDIKVFIERNDTIPTIELTDTEVVEQPEQMPEEEETVVIDTEPSEPEMVETVNPGCFEKATLYGAYWDGATKAQRDSLGDLEYSYVECAVQGDYRAQQDACKGIDGYPTWVIGGQQYVGVYDSAELLELAGCQ